MTENNHQDNDSAQYLRSNNMSNTIDNKKRHSKKEDQMSADYTNPPIGNKNESDDAAADPEQQANQSL